VNLQTYVDSAVKAARADTMANSDQLTLGEIITKCETCAALEYKLHDGSEPSVVFDFEYIHPTGLRSWRGAYPELALSFQSEGDEMKLSTFIEMLKDAIGRTFEGYKGGDFTMSRHTPVWVANYGNSGRTAVVDVINHDYEIILVTGLREY
jgi:hypothetical protein